MARRRGAALRVAPLVVMLVVMPLAGCGGTDTPSGPPPEPVLAHYTDVAALAAAVAARRAAEPTMSLHVTGVTTGAPPQSTVADAQVTFGPAGPVMRVQQSDQLLDQVPAPPFSLLIQPDRALLRPPAGTVAMPPGKDWFTVRQDPGNPALSRFNQLVAALRDTADPTGPLARLGPAATIAAATDDTLDGTPTVRYTITLDFTRAAHADGDPAVVRALADAVASGGASNRTTLWLDARNHPVRTVLTRTLGGDDGTRATYVMTVRYRDWGRRVDIPPPPPARIATR